MKPISTYLKKQEQEEVEKCNLNLSAMVASWQQMWHSRLNPNV